MERAYALRDERERARQEHVREALDQQWRDACDDARTLDSEALLRFVSNERKSQIDEKIRNKVRLTEEEMKFNEDWKRHVEALELSERQKEEHRRKIDEETAHKIKSQVYLSFSSPRNSESDLGKQRTKNENSRSSQERGR
jgi:hypothetical protein